MMRRSSRPAGLSLANAYGANIHVSVKGDTMTKLRMRIACFMTALAAIIAASLKYMRNRELSAELEETFWLDKGETAHIKGEDLSLTFKDVLNDSRCPPNVHCIWAGEVQLILNARKGDHQKDLRFKVGPAGDVVEFDEYIIAISSIEPPVPEQGTIDESDYRIELRVKR
jgi:hypothetical protein